MQCTTICEDEYKLKIIQQNQGEYIKILSLLINCIDREDTVDMMEVLRNPVNHEYILKSLTRLEKISTELDKNVSSPWEIFLSTESDTLVKYMDRIPMTMKIDNGKYVLHEYLVGSMLNKLDVPNFLYTYGYSKEKVEYITDSSKTSSKIPVFMGTKGHDYQLYTQYIPKDDTYQQNYTIIDSIGFKTELGDSDESIEYIIKIIFIQLFSAISYANYMLDFSHGNLKFNNVSLVKLDDIHAIPVMSIQDGKFVKRWIHTDLLVIIKDFSCSSIDIPEFRDIFNTRLTFHSTNWIEDILVYTEELLYRLGKSIDYMKELNIQDLCYDLTIGCPLKQELERLALTTEELLCKCIKSTISSSKEYYLAYLTDSNVMINLSEIKKNTWYRIKYGNRSESVWMAKHYRWTNSMDLRLELGKYKNPRDFAIQAYKQDHPNQKSASIKDIISYIKTL